MRQNGTPIPPGPQHRTARTPDSPQSSWPKLNLPLQPELKEKVARLALAKRLSVNEFVRRTLEETCERELPAPTADQ